MRYGRNVTQACARRSKLSNGCGRDCGGPTGNDCARTAWPGSPRTTRRDRTRHRSPHTDTVFDRDPHSYVGPACVRAAPDGEGRSLVVRVRDVVARLDESAPGATALLQDGCCPFVKGDRPPLFGPVLDRSDDDLTVRSHDSHPRDGLRLHPQTLDDAHRAALRAFADALGCASVVSTVPLGPGDLLRLDNRRTLHGRTSLAAGSTGRHFRRLKIRTPRSRRTERAALGPDDHRDSVRRPLHAPAGV